MMENDGRIVVTASSVHDPESPGGAQGVPASLGTLDGLRLQGKDCEMLDGNSFNADKAYKDSKVCTLNFVSRSCSFACVSCSMT
jgi:protochlorophyllide reductase